MNELKTNWALLGGLRFFLAFVVLSQHIQSFMHNRFAAYVMQFDSFAAVIAFLMISGYSIHHSIATRPQGYLMRRIQRIYPTYITCLLFAVWVYFYLIQTKADLPAGVIFPVPTGWSTLGNVLFLQPVFFETFPTIGPAWSLGVEALFYVLALFLVKWPRNVILFLLTASIALYVYEYSILRVYSYFGWLRPSLLLWAWLIGWLAYKNASGKLNKWSIYGLLLIPALLIHANFFTSERFAVVPCALAALAILHGDELNLSPKIAQIGNYLGELSYPLYLIHFPILFLMSCSPRPLPSLLAYPLCIGASMLVYHFVDLPLRKRRRIKKSPLQKTPLP